MPKQNRMLSLDAKDVEPHEERWSQYVGYDGDGNTSIHICDGVCWDTWDTT